METSRAWHVRLVGRSGHADGEARGSKPSPSRRRRVLWPDSSVASRPRRFSLRSHRGHGAQERGHLGTSRYSSVSFAASRSRRGVDSRFTSDRDSPHDCRPLQTIALDGGRCSCRRRAAQPSRDAGTTELIGWSEFEAGGSIRRAKVSIADGITSPDGARIGRIA